MSFAWQYKDEIVKNKALWARHKAAMAYGLLLMGRHFGPESMEMVTEHRGAAKLYGDLVSSLVGLRGSITTASRSRGGRDSFTVQVDGEEDRRRVLDFFAQNGEELNRQSLAAPEALRAFIAGAFLACGNMSDPQKSYRLEFAVPRENLLAGFGEVLQELGFQPRLALRRGLTVVYFRDSTEIEDIMTLTGAGRLALELMEVKIYKEVRNRTNRMTNCDYANMDKTINASAVQAAAIRTIVDRGGEQALPQELRRLAVLRLENPEASLRDLGELMEPPLTRSEVNRRLGRLLRLAGQTPQKRRID